MSVTTREKIIASVAAGILGAMLIKAYGLPTQVSVLESRQNSLEQRFDRFETKLDRILERLGRR